MSATKTHVVTERRSITIYRNYWRVRLIKNDVYARGHDGWVVFIERQGKQGKGSEQRDKDVQLEIEAVKRMIREKVNPDTDEDGEFAGYELDVQILVWSGNVTEL